MCGICMVFGSEDTALLSGELLYKLNNRGRQSTKLWTRKGIWPETFGGKPGLAKENLDLAELSSVVADIAIGQNKYTTMGKTSERNSQPFEMNTPFGQMVYAHNGQLGSSEEVKSHKNELEIRGQSFQDDISTFTDSRLLGSEFHASKEASLEGKLVDMLRNQYGSAAVVGVVGDVAFAGRRNGNRPLFIGETSDGGTVYSSENYMFNSLNIQDVGEVPPGKLYTHDLKTGKSNKVDIWKDNGQPKICILEFIYFAMPGTKFYYFSDGEATRGVTVSEMRMQSGIEAALQFPLDIDVVIPVPDSANQAALGYSQESGIPYAAGLTKTQFSGRSFIVEGQTGRENIALQKYDAIDHVIRGNKVGIVEDSIVRGTTLKELISDIKTCGPEEIHVIVGSPPVTGPCFYGIDMKTKEELIAASMSVDEIKNFLGVDSLNYLSLDNYYRGLEKLTGVKYNSGNFCDACFTGNYWDLNGKEIEQRKIENNYS